MSHLGRRLSALIDDELSDAERDQAHAHLVSCEECRAEAAALRTLKRRVRGLSETPADGALTRRLIALAALSEPPPPRPRFLAAPRPWGESSDRRDQVSAFSGDAFTHDAFTSNVFTSDAFTHDAFTGDAFTGGHSDLAPASPASPASPGGRGRGHTRYMVAGAVAAALAVSLGAASFAAGGGGQAPGPKVVPEVDVYSFEQAVTAGEVPLYQPSGGHAVRPPGRDGGSARP